MQVAEAFAGFSPGEADGLRRAMSRKRSREMLAAPPRALHRGRACGTRAPSGARRSGCGRWSRASPASASPRPTAPPSACSPTSRRGCGSTTARSSCARCSTSSRWASTPPTASSTRPSTGASQLLGLDVNASQVQCTVSLEGSGRRAAGPGLCQGCRGRRGARARGRARARGPFRSLGDLAARAGARRATLEQLAWSGACDSLLERAAQTGARPCGSWVAARPPSSAASRGSAGRPSWRCRWSCPRRRACARWGAGSG